MRMFVKDGRKLTPPASVIALQDDVVTEASTALRWVAEYIEDGLIKIDFNQPSEYFLPVKDAYQRYQNWVVMSGEKHPLNLRFFSQDIENRYDGIIRENGIRRFKGIIVTPEYQKLIGSAGINPNYGGFS